MPGHRDQVEGQPPACGLVVSNHLSYLDIIIISAAMPCFFVAKMEIGGWPFFGKAARTGGTIFLDRSSLASAMSVAEQMTERLRLPVPVLLFPEGTSTDGAEVLRFHSRLIDPATTAGAPITAAAIRYVLEGGVEERELCWFGDEQFMPHLWKVLGVAGFSAQLTSASRRSILTGARPPTRRTRRLSPGAMRTWRNRRLPKSRIDGEIGAGEGAYGRRHGTAELRAMAKGQSVRWHETAWSPP